MRLIAALAFGAALMLVKPATAQVASDASPDPVPLASAMLEQGRPDLACALLRVMADPNRPDAEMLYILGRCSRDLGMIDDAVAYYRQAIQLAPQAQKPRAELAAIYMAQGQAGEASRLFASVASDAQDPQVAAILRGLLQQLSVDDPAAAAAQQKKRWVVDTFVGIIRDTNVNVGPSASTVAAVIGGVPVDLTLSPDSAPKFSWGMTASAAARYLQPLNDRYALLFQGSISDTEYFSEHLYDSDGAALATALIYRNGGFSANLQPNIRWARQDEALQEATYGLNGRVTQIFDDGWSTTASTGWFRRRVPPSRIKDADGYLGSLGFGKEFRKLQFNGDYIIQRESAELDRESRLMHGPSALLIMPLTDEIEAVANYRYTRIAYDDRQALFPTAREDSQHLLSLAALWDLSRWLDRDIGLRAQYAYTRNHSNLAVNDYDRHSMMLGVQARF